MNSVIFIKDGAKQHLNFRHFREVVIELTEKKTFALSLFATCMTRGKRK